MIHSRYETGRLVFAAVTVFALIASTGAPLTASPQATPAAEGAPKLRIIILEGEGAVNNIRQRTARDPVVKVVDENDRPVAGAVVMFTMPLRGAGGTFANGARSVSLLTNSQGVATATGLTPNAAAGEFGIQVSASYQGQTASATIGQTNATAAAAGGLSAGATAGIIGGIVAGVAAAVVVGLTGGDNGGSPGPGPVQQPPAPPSATVTLGGPTAGPGR